MKDILQFSSPEDVGISSRDIITFINNLQRQGIPVHSFILMRRGKICAECYAPFFDKSTLHRMYSTSKSFASMALGILIGDEKVSLSDRVCDYFPEHLPGDPHPWVLETTIRDILIMASAHSGTPYNKYGNNYVSPAFTVTPNHIPGTVFNYETSCSNCIATIVEKVSGQSLMAFLLDRALREIGFSENADCVQMPQGNSWGGSGVLCTTRDLARFALLVHHDGYANGKQLIPKDYVIAAKSKQIDNSIQGARSLTAGHGYGYQIWRIAENGYAFMGLGGQCALTFPDRDLIFCITADVQDAYENYPFLAPLFYNIVQKLPSVDIGLSLPPDPEGERILQQKIQNFALPILQGKASVAYSSSINGKEYRLDENRMGIRSFRLTFDDTGGVFHYDSPSGAKQIPFGLGRYISYEFPESNYSGRQIHVPLGRGYRAISTGAWIEDRKFAIKTYIIDEYFGSTYFVFAFKDQRVTMVMRKAAECFLEEYSGEASGNQV